MMNTIRKVTIVVPVLMTSCQVSLKLKIGPVTAQARTISRASTKAWTLPIQRVTHTVNRSAGDTDLLGTGRFSSGMVLLTIGGRFVLHSAEQQACRVQVH